MKNKDRKMKALASAIKQENEIRAKYGPAQSADPADAASLYILNEYIISLRSQIAQIELEEMRDE